MNSNNNNNNLELSYLENEIDKITSKYHLPTSMMPPLQSQGNQQLSQQKQKGHQDGIQAVMKSSTVATFGDKVTAAANNATISNNRQSFYPLQASAQIQGNNANNPFQELTINKDGNVNFCNGKNIMTKINPKELSNDELEYIIKTGKLPPRYQQQQEFQENESCVIIPLQQQMQQTSNVFQNYLSNSTVNYDKENFIARNPSAKVINYDDNSSPIGLKNVNSPKQIQEANNNMNNSQLFNQQLQQQLLNLNQLPNFQHLTSQIQPIASAQHANNLSSNSIVLTTLDNSAFNKTQHQENISGSQAATQALKALQEKIKSLESQNQLLQDKLQIVEGQSIDTHGRFQQRLKEELNNFNSRETHMKEEIQILKKQLESAENEKHRHLEENSSEREQWRGQYKRVEEENTQLKRQLHDQEENYAQMEDAIKDIKRRENQLRDKFDKELESERSRVRSVEQDLEEVKQRYEDMKSKIKAQNKQLISENTELNELMQGEKDQWERERQRLQRDIEKWKRESQILKEEMSLTGSTSIPDNNSAVQSKQKTKKTNKNTITYFTCSNAASTPKEPQILSARSFSKCKSPSLKKEQQPHVPGLASQNTEVKQMLQCIVKEASENKVNKLESTQKASRNFNSKSNLSGAKSSQEKSSERKSSSKKRISNNQRAKISTKLCQRSSSQKKLNKKPTQEMQNKKTLSQANSQSNLISINTKEVKQESVPANANYDYIVVTCDNRKEQNLDNHSSGNQSIQMQKNKTNDSAVSSSIVQFGLNSTGSDYSNSLTSHQSSVDHLVDVRYTKPLELRDISLQGSKKKDIPDKQTVDNEIFYLEREIFDYNQQYKTLLSQQSNTNSTSSSQAYQLQPANINQQLRQIALLLEQRSERLFELKKQQQQILLQDTYASVGSMSSCGSVGAGSAARQLYL